jgi:hypothetical protein
MRAAVILRCEPSLGEPITRSSGGGRGEGRGTVAAKIAASRVGPTTCSHLIDVRRPTRKFWIHIERIASPITRIAPDDAEPVIGRAFARPVGIAEAIRSLPAKSGAKLGGNRRRVPWRCGFGGCRTAQRAHAHARAVMRSKEQSFLNRWHSSGQFGRRKSSRRFARSVW